MAAWQRQEADAEEAAREKEGGDGPQHSEEGAERLGESAAKEEQASPVAASGEERGADHKGEDTVSPDDASPAQAVADGTTASGTTTGATSGAGGMATTAMHDSQVGGEESEATAGDVLEAAATVGTPRGNPPVIAEEASGPEEIVAKSVPKALDGKTRGHDNDSQEQIVEEDDKEHDSVTVASPVKGSGPQLSEALQDAPSHEEQKGREREEHQGREGEGGGPQGRAPAGGSSVAASAASGDSGSSGNPARLELAKRRKDVALLRAEAKEGMTFVSQSVDMADVLRGFVFTRHGIPVRDPVVGLELLREGRSTRRDRSGPRTSTI